VSISGANPQQPINGVLFPSFPQFSEEVESESGQSRGLLQRPVDYSRVSGPSRQKKGKRKEGTKSGRYKRGLTNGEEAEQDPPESAVRNLGGRGYPHNVNQDSKKRTIHPISRWGGEPLRIWWSRLRLQCQKKITF